MPTLQGRETAAEKTARLCREAGQEAVRRYKERVLAVATEARHKNNWCDEGFKDAMESLDIEVLSPYSVTLSVTIEVQNQPSADAASMTVEDGVESLLRTNLPEGMVLEGMGVDDVYSED